MPSATGPVAYIDPGNFATNILGGTQFGYRLLWVLLCGFGLFFYLAGVWRLHKRGDKWPIYRTICWLLGCLALIWVTSGGPGRKDCIEVTFASTLGGATEHACGALARRVCASPDAFKHVEDALAASCRRAGFPFR